MKSLDDEIECLKQRLIEKGVDIEKFERDIMKKLSDDESSEEDEELLPTSKTSEKNHINKMGDKNSLQK